MYNLILCAIFRNEAHILKEWIEHYFFHGIEHIFLVNDFSTDNYLEVLYEIYNKNEKYKERITLFHNDIITEQVGRQNMIVNKYFRNLLYLSKWITILDLDEFLYCPNEINIQKVLEKYEQYNSITIEWYFFGSNGHIKQPLSVVEGFTKRQIKDINKINPHKFIVKCKSVINIHIHHCDVHGPWIHLNLDNHHCSDFIINHYNIQSYDWFMNVKSGRGDINNYAQNVGVVRNENYFRQYDTNDVYDDKLYQQNKNILLKLKN